MSAVQLRFSEQAPVSVQAEGENSVSRAIFSQAPVLLQAEASLHLAASPFLLVSQVACPATHLVVKEQAVVAAQDVASQAVAWQAVVCEQAVSEQADEREQPLFVSQLVDLAHCVVGSQAVVCSQAALDSQLRVFVQFDFCSQFAC